jgi:hypothetical protein
MVKSKLSITFTKVVQRNTFIQIAFGAMHGGTTIFEFMDYKFISGENFITGNLVFVESSTDL